MLAWSTSREQAAGHLKHYKSLVNMWCMAPNPLIGKRFLRTSESMAASTTPNVESYWVLTCTVHLTY